MPEHFLNEDRVRRQIRRRRLSEAQRRKHLRQIDRAIAGRERDMDFLRNRSRAEFGLLAVVVALLALGFVVWNTVLDGGGGDTDEPQDALAMANATLTARELLPAATLTPTSLPPTPTLAPSPTPNIMPPAVACVPTQLADPDAIPIHVPVSTSDPTTARWYGDDEDGLWASVLDRTLLFPDTTPDAASLWFAGESSWVTWYGALEPVTVTGRQLGGSATLEDFVSKGRNAGLEWTQFTIPAPGCWEITGSASGKSLTVTVEVLPFEQRPDIIYVQRAYQARPYVEPASCPVTPLVGPESRGDNWAAHYWLEAKGISVDIGGWFIAGRELYLGAYGEDVDSALSATATRLDDDSGEVIEAPTQIFNADSRSVRYTFPSGGCWELEMTTPTVTATFVIYVYPEECMPTEDGEFSAACAPPRE